MGRVSESARLPRGQVAKVRSVVNATSPLDFLPRRVQPQLYCCILILIVSGSVLVLDLSAIWCILVLPTKCLQIPNRAGDRVGRWGGGDPLLSTPPPQATTPLTRSLPLGWLNRPHRPPPLSVLSGPPDHLHRPCRMAPALTLLALPGCPPHPRLLLELRQGAFALQRPLFAWVPRGRPRRSQFLIRSR